VSTDWYQDVLDFHRKFGCVVGEFPAVPSKGTKELRSDLLWEEWCETEAALRRDDLTGIADGIADMIYVALGLAVSYGIDLRPVWDAVHASNMAKEGGATREDGKILKPPGWVAPDVAGILLKQINGEK
jgi:predicted HAD superfamily Cof-like phosphohydrolase